MFAVIKTGGKQYLVKAGDVLNVEKLDVKQGEKVSLDALLTFDKDALNIGTPMLSGKIMAEVLEQSRSVKVEVVKYKAKSRYTRRVGHRQYYTKIKIGDIA